MKKFRFLVFIIFAFVMIFGDFAGLTYALNVQPSPLPATSPDIIVTSLAGNPLLDDLEIYNQADGPVNLSGWSFTFTLTDSGACNGKVISVNFPNAWILPEHYLTMQRGGDPSTVGSFNVDSSFLASCTAPWISALQILNGTAPEQNIVLPSATILPAGSIAQHHQRNNSPSSTRTLDGTFTDDYKVAAISTSTTIYNDPLYIPPTSTAGLEVVEILANSEDCSPLDSRLDCGDFVKLYNSSNSAVDLSNYRLRTSYDGNKSTSSNTVSLSGTLAAGGYTVVNTKNDSSPLSLTDTGGYVWLEDALGAADFQPLIQYPDASPSAKVGWAWGLNDDTWQWSSEPTLSANVFPVQPQTTTLSATSSLSPCAPNQFRNPATDRCKLIASSSSSQDLTACAANQERNPATNRCRAVLAASTSLKPCTAGQTRNPATNRCRNSAGANVASIKDVKSPAKASNLKWFLVLLAAVIALGYAFYEWQPEMLQAYQKIKSKTEKFKLKK